MATGLTLTVNGLPQAMGFINNLTSEITLQILMIFMAGAQQCLDDSQTMVPVLTGALRDSAWITHEEGEIAVGYGPGVNGDVDYAQFVELGTYKMSAQPFLVPAFIGAVTQIEADLSTIVS